MPPEQSTFTDEEIVAKETRLDELHEKDAKTEAEKEEIRSLKIEVKEARRIKLAEIANDAKLSKFKAEEARREAEAIKTEKEELEKKIKPAKVEATGERIVEINGKQYYTNDALQELIDAGKWTIEKANAHAEERNEERLFIKFKERNKQEEVRDSFLKSQAADWEEVKKKHPEFDKNHPKFDPDDPLYKEANDLFISGFHTHPKGFSKALEKAERILGINKGRPDVTDELNVPVGGRPLEKTPVDDVALSDYEKDSAEKQFCRGDVINPKTNRPYTKDEALVRALKAKKDMLASRRAR